MRFCFLAVFAWTNYCFGQAPTDLFSKAPPAVDAALRERVQAFYQAQSNGKFREAEKLVAEESKDAYFEADKRRCRKFEIVKINYTDNFTKATALTNCDTDMVMVPGGVIRVTMPVSSIWVVQQENWYWTVPIRKNRESGFGTLTPGPGEDEIVKIPTGPSPDDLRKLVTVDRTRVPLNPGVLTTESVKIKNSMNGTVKLRLQTTGAEDLQISLDKSELKLNEEAVLTIVYKPMPEKQRAAGTFEEAKISVEPLHTELRFRLEWGKAGDGLPPQR